MAIKLTNSYIETNDYIMLRDNLEPDVEYEYNGKIIFMPKNSFNKLKNKLLCVDTMFADNTISASIYDTKTDTIEEPDEWEAMNVPINDCHKSFFKSVTIGDYRAHVKSLYKAKYKSGDKVIIKETLEKEYKYFDINTQEIETMRITSKMKNLAGKQVTIKRKNEIGCYYIFEDNNYWCDEMFSGLANEKPILKPQVITSMDEIKNNDEERGNVKMNKMSDMLKRMFGEIGQVSDGSLAMTFTGAVAVKRANGDYVRYDDKSGNIENQGDFILPDSGKFMFLMPTPTVQIGDIIKNGDKYNQVLAIKENGAISAVNFSNGSKTTILKETNIFGMNFYTKVTSMMNGFMNPDPNGAAGGFNPMMLMAFMGDESKEMDMTTLLMLSGMFGGQQNPQAMLPLLLMNKDKSDDSKDLMTTMAMMSMFSGGQGMFSGMFGQTTTPMQIAEPLKPITDYKLMSEMQGDLIKKMQARIEELVSIKTEVPAVKKEERKTPAGKKVAEKQDKSLTDEI